MTTPIALLLIALFLAGIGLFVRAYVRGMQFGDRLDAQNRPGEENEEKRRGPDSSDAP